MTIIYLNFSCGRYTRCLFTFLDGEQDPAPKFFSPNVQVLLKRLTRPDFSKVFRKRTNHGLNILKTPTYKFLTNEELEEEIAKANEKADRLLQMPPIVKVRKALAHNKKLMCISVIRT